MPGFLRWRAAQDGADGLLRPPEIDILLDVPPALSNPLRQAAATALRRADARYLLDGEGARPPPDPVAHFHLGNGAEAWRLNPFADLSMNGRRQSFGLMAYCRYDSLRGRARQEREAGARRLRRRARDDAARA